MTRTALALCALGLVSAARAATVLVGNPDGGLGDAKVRDGHVLVGLVGDHVALGPGNHELRIDGPRDYTLLISLRVDARAVTVVGARTEPGNCRPQFEVAWKTPTVTAVRSHANAATLIVHTPTFGKPLEQGFCALPSMLGCTKQFSTVVVDSVPPGGDIWVAGAPTNVKTRGVLSVPFCPAYEKTKPLLVRLQGRVTCVRDVALAEGKRVEVSCELPLPP